MKWMLPLLFFGCLVCSLLAFVSIRDLDKKTRIETDREIIVMRKIAHQLMWQNGDSSSRILPVKQLAKNEFLISFQSSFSFKPDSLVQVIDRQIALHELPGDYVVNVLDCQTDDVIYGYAIFNSKQKNIVPCLGRQQPEKKYCINIQFAEAENTSARAFLIAGFALLLSAIALAPLRLFKRKTASSQPEPTANLQPHADAEAISIGAYRFFANQQLLQYKDEKILLTQKEAKLLGIFAAAPNQVIDRSRLQKEIWEDEGVIVGRSLDMFVSRLRKKLESDPSVKLANIHGKGYKLEIS